MAFVPLLAVAGAAISAVGTISSAEASANSAHYGAAVARNNAIVANQNSDYAIASGLQKAETEGLKGASTLGKIKAGQAANNVDVNTGSANDVQVGSREASELDSETVLNNAQLSAFGYRSQATGFEAESKLKDSEADSDITSGFLKAGGGLLGSASSLPGGWSGGGGTVDVPGWNPVAGVSGQ